MATTTPDNIYYPVSTDQVAPLASHFENLADTTQDALTRIKQTQRMYVKNGAVALTKGTPVYITGADGTNVIVGAASNATEGGSSKTIGLLETDLAINAMGYVVTAGLCTNIDTSGAGAAGDPVWLGVNGAKIYGLANKPVAPAHMVYLGVVTRKNANTGEIEVRVQNGFELEELHNVLITNPQDKQVVAYEGGLWKNKQATGGVTVGATAPAGPNPGDAWYNSNNGMLYVWYVDADSTAQWVQVKANSGLEASILARLGGLESQAIAYGNQNPNLVINGGMDVWQRGTTQSMWQNTYVADRWFCNSSTSTIFSQDTTTIFPGLRYGLKAVAGAAASTQTIYQCFETAHTSSLIGKIVTLSSYVNSTSPISMVASIQYSTTIDAPLIGGGSGWVDIGSTNTSVSANTVTRISTTQAIPSSAKSIRIVIGTVSAAPSGSTVSFSGVQLEVGSTATAFRRNQPNIQAELAACQRYYFRSANSGVENYALAGFGVMQSANTFVAYVQPPVPMRASPTAFEYSNMAVRRFDIGGTTLSAMGMFNVSPNGCGVYGTTAASWTTGQTGFLTKSNDANAYVAFSAEL